MPNLTIETLEVVIEHKASEASARTDQLVQSLTKIKEVLRGSSAKIGKFTQSIDAMAASINSIDIERLRALSNVLGKLQKAKAPNVSVSTVSKPQTVKRTKPQGDVTDILQGKPEQGGVGSDIPKLKNTKKSLSDLEKTTKKVGKTSKKASSSIGKIAKSFGRIAMYRAIRAAIAAVTKTLKEGTENLYAYDKLVGGTFSKSMDEASTSVQYLKSSLITAIAPALQALVPIITQIADGIGEFSRGIAVLSAKNNGLDKVTVAKKSMKEFATDAQNAKNALMGFDELNVVSGDQDMFETIAVDESTVSEYTDSLAGSIIGLVNEIKPIVKSLYSFVMKLTDKSMGQLSSLFDGVSKALPSILDFVNNLLDRMPMIEKLFDSTADFNSGTLPTILSFVATLITLIDELLELPLQLITGLISEIANILNGSVRTILPTITQFLKLVISVVTRLNETLQPIIDLVLELFSFIGSVLITILQPFAKIFSETLMPLLTSLVDNVLSVIFPIVSSLLEPLTIIAESVLPLLSGWIELFASVIGVILSPLTGLFKILQPIFEIVGMFGEILSPIFGILNSVFEFTLKPICEVLGLILGFITDIFDGIAKIFSGDFEGGFAKLGETFGNAKKIFTEDLPNIFVEAWKNLDNKVKQMWNNFVNIGINIVNAIIEGLNTLGNFTIPGFSIGAWQIWGDTPVNLFNIPKIPTYATGGFPEDGLFFANHNEMVGQFTNGRSAVANNEQIVEGISDGVYNAVVAALSGNGGYDGRSMNVNVYLDGKQIKSSIDKLNYQSGARIATGGIQF